MIYSAYVDLAFAKYFEFQTDFETNDTDHPFKIVMKLNFIKVKFKEFDW